MDSVGKQEDKTNGSENSKEADCERRNLLKYLGIGAAGAVLSATVGSKAVFAAPKKKQWGMLVDLRRCIGCNGCTVACKAENEVPLGVFRRRVRTSMAGSFPDVRRHMIPISCFHCADPKCLKACKVNAISKTDEGFVLIDEDKCESKKRCRLACPYRNIFLNPITKKSNKCTFCEHRVKNGVLPACVQTCTGGALMFGDLNDPASEISKAIKAGKAKVLKPEAKTKPSFYYLGLDTETEAALKKILKKRGSAKPQELENDR